MFNFTISGLPVSYRAGFDRKTAIFRTETIYRAYLRSYFRIDFSHIGNWDPADATAASSFGSFDVIDLESGNVVAGKTHRSSLRTHRSPRSYIGRRHHIRYVHLTSTRIPIYETARSRLFNRRFDPCSPRYYSILLYIVVYIHIYPDIEHRHI